jgi:hypothetical protein
LSDIEDCEMFARAMNVPNWLERVELAKQSELWHFVEISWTHLCETPISESEVTITHRFCALVALIANCLGVCCLAKNETRFGVGGLLADGNYAFCGKTDVIFLVHNRESPACSMHGTDSRSTREYSAEKEGVHVLGMEFKSAESFPKGHI